MSTATAPPRTAYCRMQDSRGNRCTGEALVDGDVLICTTHAAAVMALIALRMAAVRRGGS